MPDSLYDKVTILVSSLRAEYAELSKDGVLSWKEAVQLTVHAGRELASLVNGIRAVDRRGLLRDAAEQLFDQVIGPILATKLKSKWYLKIASGFVIPYARAFWMQTAEAAFDWWGSRQRRCDLAKRKPAKRKPRAAPVIVPSDITHVDVEPPVPAVVPVEPVKPEPKPSYRGYAAVFVLWLVSMGAVFWFATPHGVDPPEPEPSRPIVTLEDTPAAAVTKSHARYILNFGDSLEEFAELAPTFGDSAAAAKWFTDRTARARAEAFSGKDGFDAYVFGHAGGDDNGEDRYDAKTLAKGAKEMAEACRKSAQNILK